MKKQLSMFAAAAMLVSFAVAASAAPATVTMTGGMLYSVEYNLLDRTWDPAEAGLNNAAPAVTIAVTTTGNPNVGTITLSSFGGAYATAISGTVKGYGLDLGTVSSDWDGMVAGTGGPGAKVSKTIGASAFTVATSSGAVITNGGRIATTLGKAAVVGGIVVDPNWKGLGYVVASSKVGIADVTVKAGKLLGATATALFGKVALPVGPASIVVKVAKAPAAYKDFALAKVDTGASGAGDATDIEKLGWVANDGTRSTGVNLFVRADMPFNPSVKAYAELNAKGNNSYALKAGTSYATLYVTDAYVALNDVGDTEFVASFGKGVISAFVGYNMLSGKPAQTKAEVKATKVVEWLTTWASVGKAYDKATPYVKAGASASVSF